MDDLRQEISTSDTEIDSVIVLMKQYGSSLDVDASLVGGSEIRPESLLAYMGLIEQKVMEMMFELGMLQSVKSQVVVSAGSKTPSQIDFHKLDDLQANSDSDSDEDAVQI